MWLNRMATLFFLASVYLLIGSNAQTTTGITQETTAPSDLTNYREFPTESLLALCQQELCNVTQDFYILNTEYCTGNVNDVTEITEKTPFSMRIVSSPELPKFLCFLKFHSLKQRFNLKRLVKIFLNKQAKCVYFYFIGYRPYCMSVVFRLLETLNRRPWRCSWGDSINIP